MSTHIDNQTTEWLAALTAHIRIMTKCPFCNFRLSVHEPPNGTDVQAFTILPCGHAFGYDCIKEWLESSPQCPTCDASAEHPRCGHLAKLEKMEQKDNKLYLEIMDPADFPALCDDCRRRERERRERERTSSGRSNK
ncbi:hypothetical protein F5B18DRAFT_648324 [Nemania serpens]|nr:hypothetical protein F5B18DRAFT_648324 [Nemania serpens]